MAQESSDLGNTKTRSRSRNYVFTLNNYTNEDIDNIILMCHTKEYKYIFQEEKGERGTPHLQGYLMAQYPIDFNAINKLFKWHVEKARGSKLQNMNYCSKISDRIGEVFSNMPEFVVIKDNYLKQQPYAYQLEILELIKKEPDERIIYWYWEPKGNTGKSTFCKHLALKYNAFIMSGKGNDIKYAICSMDKKPTLIVMDIPRCNNNYISYDTLESVKNGMFFNTKYESQMVLMNSPHLIIFSNEEPDREKMSGDRWCVRPINITPE